MLNITSPYPYKEFKRKSVNGKRLYENPYGEPVPSVTTILSKTKDMTHLNAWKKRVGEKKAQEIVTEAASVGTVMHEILEAWSLNQEYTGKNLLQAKMMAETVIKNVEADIDEVWGSEVNLCYPGLYAGTTDLVGVYKGRPTIMDFKQTNKPKKRSGSTITLCKLRLMVWHTTKCLVLRLNMRPSLCVVEIVIGNYGKWDQRNLNNGKKNGQTG